MQEDLRPSLALALIRNLNHQVIVHKLLYSLDWVVWAYVALFCVVGFDICLYFRNLRYDRMADDASTREG